MTNEEALKILPDMKGAGDDWDKAIDLAIEALKQQGSSQQTAVGSQGLANDTVSRQGAIDAIEKAKTAKAPDGEMYVAKINAEMNIQLLPSVQPQYEELTSEETASEIASGSIMSASYWLDIMIRLKQMGYAICRKENQ